MTPNVKQNSNFLSVTQFLPVTFRLIYNSISRIIIYYMTTVGPDSSAGTSLPRRVVTEWLLWPFPIGYCQMHHNIFDWVRPGRDRSWPRTPGKPWPAISKIIESWNKVWSPFKSINLLFCFLVKPFMIDNFINARPTNVILR